MSKYTTGEIAKLCGVSVRTVQYYDSREILVPSALSEGGRRLYSDADLERMKTICFLREMGLSINTIAELLREDDPISVISIILDQHEAELRTESDVLQKKLDMVADLRRALDAQVHHLIAAMAGIALLAIRRAAEFDLQPLAVHGLHNAGSFHITGSSWWLMNAL